MSVLNYKDYQGSVEFDGNTLVVKILHINDSVSTECDSASAAKSTFEELVEDYLETCSEIGREPEKPYRGSFNVRVGPEIHKKAVLAATAKGMSLNAWMIGTITSAMSKTSELSSDKIDEVSELIIRRNNQAKLNYSSASIEMFSAERMSARQETVEKYYSTQNVPDKESGRYGH